jgi:peroxiredoxin
MKTLLLLGGALGASLASSLAPARLKPGDAAPDFTVKTLDGKDRNLAFFRGDKKDRIVVLNFWSHACPWSRAWDAELSKIAKDYAPKNVLVVSIDSNKSGHAQDGNSDTPEDIARYAKANTLGFEVYVDATARVADAFGGQTTPDIFLIGPDGKLAYTGRINDMQSYKKPTEFEKSHLRSALDSVLAGKPVADATTPPAGCSIKRAKKDGA